MDQETLLGVGTVCTVAGTALGAAALKISQAIAVWRKSAAEGEAIDRRHLSTTNAELLNNLQNQVTWLSAKLQSVQDHYEDKMAAAQVQHEQCQRDNAELRGEVRALKLRLDILSGAQLERALEAQRGQKEDHASPPG